MNLLLSSLPEVLSGLVVEEREYKLNQRGPTMGLRVQQAKLKTCFPFCLLPIENGLFWAPVFDP